MPEASEVIPEALLADTFDDPRPPGAVLGTPARRGGVRLGADREHVLSIDGGALRVAPLIEAGWGRATLSYGPVACAPGTIFGITLMNGHNTSQAEPLSEAFGDRIARWIAGPHDRPPLHTRVARLRRLAGANRFDRLTRQVLWWFRTDERTRSVPRLDDNLKVGWFVDPRGLPAGGEPAFTVQALGARNGALAVPLGDAACTQVVQDVQNLPLVLVTIVREDTILYALASFAGARGLGPGWPRLRPVAVGPRPREARGYVGLSQATLGQIGFRADTRVFGVKALQEDAWVSWAAGAAIADRLVDEPQGALPLGRGLVREASGTRVSTGAAVDATLATAEPAGLLRVRVQRAQAGEAGLTFRQGAAGAWRLMATKEGAALSFEPRDGVEERLQTRVCADEELHLQVIDDGHALMASVNGLPLAARPLVDARSSEGCGVGLSARGAEGARLRDFEAQPRTFSLPALADLPWLDPPAAARTVLSDDFMRSSAVPHGEAEEMTLEKHSCAQGLRWRRAYGQGRVLVLPEGGARVVGSVENPSPDRTIFTLPWRRPELAELEVQIEAPGSGRAQGEKCRAGFVFWQDHDNYIVVSAYLDDHYAGASLSSFFCLGGYEDLYDAIWTNVGDRISWGRRFCLRVAFDGQAYLAHIDDEPVLYRRLNDVYPAQPRLQIRRVGLVANWEWGQDTGSVFRRFRARSR